MVDCPSRRPGARAAAEQARSPILGSRFRDVGLEHLRAPRVLDPRVAKLGLEDLGLDIRGSRAEPSAPLVVLGPTLPPSRLDPPCSDQGSEIWVLSICEHLGS
eukprot:6001307-Pyramimonas_sp.AAC.1